MKYDWLLLDADNTLFDYDRAESKALKGAIEQLGCEFKPEFIQAYRQINDEIWKAFERGEITQANLRYRRFQLLFETVELDLDPATFSPVYLHHLGQGVDLIEGAEELVRTLHGKVGLALITNGLKDVQKSRLALSTIESFFDAVVISEEVGASKPDARIFEIAFDRMGNPPRERVLMVGDSLTSDMRGASAFGIDTCWFNPNKKSNAEKVEIVYEIRRLKALFPILCPT